MKRVLCMVLLMVGASARAHAQLPGTIAAEVGHTTFVALPGVTAAYPIDAAIVGVDVTLGGIKITAKYPGQTHLVLVSAAGVRSVLVVVTPPQQAAKTQPGGGSETGLFETSYSNSPFILTNSEDVTQVQGERKIHVVIVNTDLMPGSGEQPVGFPLLSYQIANPRRSVTFVDSFINNTELTAEQALVRGFHFQQGPWTFHAGITSVEQFQDFLLPSDRELVVGLSRQFRLTGRSTLLGNLYYFGTNTKINPNATPGTIGTAAYQYTAGDRMSATAELGVGYGVAVAGSLQSVNPRQQLVADFRYQPPKFAALSLTELHGRVADLNWTRKVMSRVTSQVSFTDTALNLATDQQDITQGNWSLTVRTTPHLSFTGGATGSRFVSTLPVAPEIKSFGFLLGPQLTWQHFGTSFIYQDLRNSGNNPDSHNYQINADTSRGRLSLSGFYGRESEAAVFSPVQTTQPQLRQLLERESLLARTPEKITQYVRDTAGLTAQGTLQPAILSLAAQQVQYGGDINWSREKFGRIDFNALMNKNTGGSAASLQVTTAGITYTRSISRTNTATADFSIFQSGVPGQQQSTQPIVELTLQHQLSSAPHWLIPGRHGVIEGHLFLDPLYTQIYAADLAPLANVEVVLDGSRTVRSDQHGFYRFRNVPFGPHRVEVRYTDSRPFYYTGSSPRTVETGGTADFGISFTQGRIFGSVVNDAGVGLNGIALLVSGQGITTHAVTGSDGQFEVDGLPDGAYELSPDSSTFPAGYSLGQIQSQSVQVAARVAAHPTFRVLAQRSIAGRVGFYDPVNGRFAPVADCLVTLADLNLTASTDAQGRFLFRRMPAGDHKIEVRYQGKVYLRTASLSADPEIQSEVDVIVVPQAEAFSGGSTK